MLSKIKFKFLLATTLSFTLINSVELQLPSDRQPVRLTLGSEAEAKSSGARSRSGSFKKRSSPSSSTSRPSSSSSHRQRNSSSGFSNNRSNSGASGSRTVIVAPGGSSYSGGTHRSGVGIFPMFFLLGFFGIVALIVVANMLKSGGSHDAANSAGVASSSNRERDNDIVTISKLQVALLAQAKEVQSELSELSLRVDTETDEGLSELLQESVLVLLRNSEYWSHVLASSQSLHIDKAEQAFSKLSFEERGKFSAETLTNVDGKIRQKEIASPDGEIPAYIVVTLLAGTADDRPLFEEIRSTEALQEALEKLASIRSDYLMTFELLWSPQVQTDSLTYEELLTEYTDMVQIA